MLTNNFGGEQVLCRKSDTAKKVARVPMMYVSQKLLSVDQFAK